MKATKVTMQFVTLLYFLAFAQAQDDPQDIADTACLYSGATYEFNSVEGYIESPNYPNEYASSEECRWYINPSGGIPSGQGMYLEIIDFSTESCCDEIWVRVGDGVWGQLLYELAGSYSSGQFFFLGSEPVTLQFTSDGSVTYPGFNVRFYMGDKSPGQILADIACDDETLPLTLYNETNILETPDYPVADHPYGTQCQWILLPQNNNNGIYLSVLYFYAYNYLYIYFGDDPTGDDYETYWYGSYSPGHGIYSPGNAMSLRYEGYYNYDGFQLVYFQADPACTSGSASVIAVNEKAELKSPGYPYVLSEHLSCRWLLEAPEGQKITLTLLDLDLYGNGVDCTDEYVEVLDGDTVDALSLGKFCGNVTFGTIPSTSNALQVYLRTHEEAIFQTHTGFRFEHETQ